MKKLAVTVMLITSLLLTPALAADLRIGVVDVEEIVNKSPEYKRIEASLKRKSEELGRGIIKPDAQKRKQQDLQKKFQDIQKSKNSAARTFQQYYEREMKPLMDKFNRAVEQVANDEKLDLIIPKAGVFVRNKSLDVTEKVRSRFR